MDPNYTGILIGALFLVAAGVCAHRGNVGVFGYLVERRDEPTQFWTAIGALCGAGLVFLLSAILPLR